MVWRRLRKIYKWQGNRKFAMVHGLTHWQVKRLTPNFTANQLTVIGLFLCMPMTLLYLFDFYWAASVLLAVSAWTDWMDGAVAHDQQGLRPAMTLEEERQLGLMARINYRGVTHLGKSLDPFTDKVRFFCTLYPLGWGIVSGWLIITLTIVATALTVVRPAKRWLKLGDGRSNRFGKFKVWAEYLALTFLILAPTSKWLLDTTFIVALILGLFSLGGHFLSGAWELRKRRLAQRKRYRRTHASTSPPAGRGLDTDF